MISFGNQDDALVRWAEFIYWGRRHPLTFSMEHEGQTYTSGGGKQHDNHDEYPRQILRHLPSGGDGGVSDECVPGHRVSGGFAASRHGSAGSGVGEAGMADKQPLGATGSVAGEGWRHGHRTQESVNTAERLRSRSAMTRYMAGDEAAFQNAFKELCIYDAEQKQKEKADVGSDT